MYIHQGVRHPISPSVERTRRTSLAHRIRSEEFEQGNHGGQIFLAAEGSDEDA
jgi:hypothetical protein